MLATQRVPVPPTEDQPLEFRKKDGSLSKMRNHRGNIPILPQTKLCPHCPAKFTRTTHLNRHLRTHTNERLHRCDICDSQFTRSDLLTRHKKSCSDPSSRTRRKSCASCMESKIKCDRQYPCSKCVSRGKECIFNGSGRRTTMASVPVQQNPPTTAPYTDSSSESSTSPSTMFSTPESTPAYNAGTYQIQEADEYTQTLNDEASLEPLGRSDLLSSSVSMPSFSKTENFALEGFLSSASAVELYSSNPAGGETTDDADDRLVPVNSHLSSAYVSDMFEPFFSNIFSMSPSMPLSEDWGWEGLTSNPPDILPFVTQGGVVLPRAIEGYDDGQSLDSGLDTQAFSSPVRLALSDVRRSSLMNADPPELELQHYLYLFFSAFLSQIPIVHATTFSSDQKPPVLLGAMQACGALFVKTRKASMFITKTLASAREALVQEFAKNPTDSSDQIHLILAVVLLQTIGLFHQQPDQRASSSIYHGMLVMMIRRTGMITKNASWEPKSLTDTPLEILWQEWVVNETTKRAIWWSYMHDCCHSIYFALPSSYHPSEIELNLPCEDSLWRATTAADWFIALQEDSPYGSTTSRLTGLNMLQCLASISETRLLEVYIPLNPFSHFILIHAMLRDLFVTCVEGRLPRGVAAPAVDQNEIVNQEIYRLQYALHNWLQNWLNSPELPKVDDANEEPPFIANALPFYWLGQVSLLAFQEALPPFEQDSPNNLKVEVRFRLVKQWLRHIRNFLKKGDQAPTLFWDELMKIRLQTWQQEFEGGEEDDQDGLLGFFPEH
ncbi:putative GAL4-like Zn(II)2Cys6 (or C6 zinc) binuclear cluster DNA-binding domain [Lyophyllum shimeji]|uniref:GAL4-like Zn(II)2Cys6 (Or C6 zinc) binuclear cluster DNA-binding domain n=1 Tax=Lyophyllum shimeji TaxID=47721 RepID=A0A9P3UJT7_LYOSH|nr:putative GAL4-like Zn(II)2Cys6 (or C6 zinc) binuclear cluster DNA-binding domain [Lyophyllum shimeji]